jgi:TolB-like protein
VGYLAAALALTHAEELIAHAYGWPESIGQILIALLGIGLPVAVALAWYHGHRASPHVTGAEATIIAILLLMGSGLLWLLVRPHEAAPRTPVAAASAPTARAPTSWPAATPAASVAVVPFANLTGEPSKEYFSDGMAEELINALANVPGLKVASRISSFAYKGRNTDIRQIARDLGVATILEGSVRSAGERIRVAVQLVNAQTGFHLWSQSYDRKYADIFKLPDDLGSEIVAALRITMNTAR